MTSIIKVNTFQDTNGNALFNSDGSGNVTTSATGLQNTPAFFAYLGSNQTISNNTVTKININTELFDTNSMYDNSSNYRFTPTVAGKYYLYASFYADCGGSQFQNGWISIYKNGSAYIYGQFDNTSGNDANGVNIPVSITDEANGSSDYYEIYCKIEDSSGSPVINANTKRTHFGAYKLIGA
jgi:hypothetical protein